MYWRRFAVSEIPIDDAESFAAWMSARWQEKEQLLEHYSRTGLFPADDAGPADTGKNKAGYIDTDVRLGKWYEIGQIFVVPVSLALVANVVSKLLAMFSSLFRY